MKSISLKVHHIDLDVDSLKETLERTGFTDHGHKIVDKEGSGILEIDFSKVKIVLSLMRWRDKIIMCHHLVMNLDGREIEISNACVLDYLLVHPELLSKLWKNKDEEVTPLFLCFLGTTYLSEDNEVFFRYIHWNWREEKWDWNWSC